MFRRLLFTALIVLSVTLPIGAAQLSTDRAQAAPTCVLETAHYYVWPTSEHLESANCVEAYSGFVWDGMARTLLTDHSDGHLPFYALQVSALEWASDNCEGLYGWTARFDDSSHASDHYFSGWAYGYGSYYDCPEWAVHNYRLQSSHYFYWPDWATYRLLNMDHIL